MPFGHSAETRNDLEQMRGLPGDARGPMLEQKQRYIDWLSLPPNRREPSSQAKMAKELDVSEQTLRAWKRDPRIIAKVKGKIQSVIALNDLAEIVDTLKEQAFDAQNPRSVQAAKVLLDLMEQGQNQGVETPLSEMSLDELKQLTSGLYDELDERKSA